MVFMDTGLRGKTALITGGSSGIGLGIAQVLASEGVDVAVASRKPDQAVVDQLKSQGSNALGIAADVTSESDVVAMFREAIDTFGHLDLFINNAARAIHKPITQIDRPQYDAVIGTNLTGCLFACREAARHMIPRKSGAILIVGSTSMFTPGPTEIVYRISKYGLRPIMQSLAIELAPHNIRCNLLIPGYYRTRLTADIPDQVEDQLMQEIPLGRAGETVECGSAAALLLSDQVGGYITGAELLVDGGVSLRPMFFGNQAELAALNDPPET